MTADFFTKKRWFYVVAYAMLLVFISTCMYHTLMLKRAISVWVGKSFYFLISENTHIDVGVYETRLDGGAGYLLHFDGKDYVAWSVYFNEADGEAVQVGLSEPTQLLRKNISYLYLKTRADKKNKEIIQGALNSFYGCIDILAQGIAKLEQGLTQQSCKRILTLLNKKYAYMQKVYQETYPQFSKICANLYLQLDDILSKPIYCKDLRHVLCEACDSYIYLASFFSL